MRRDEFLINLLFGASVLFWGIAGLYQGIFREVSLVRLSSASLNTGLGLLILFRRSAVKQGSVSATLISLPSFLLGGILFKMAQPLAAWPLVPALVFTCGVAWTLFACTFLGKNFAIFPHLRGISTHGPYGIIRHPCYAGELVLTACCFAVHGTLLAAAIWLVFLVFLYFRIREEEKLLSGSDAYVEYTQAVKWRLLPWVW